MNELRILTVRQPWAHAIVHFGKDVENRSRNVAGSYRGPVAIHAGKAADRDAPKWLWGDFHDSGQEAFGAIVGVVDFVGVHYSGVEGCGTGEGDGPIPMCSEWCEPVAHHLVLANPRPLTVPIPFRGALGLRRLDDETAAAVWAAIRKEQ